jgi:hypothetical protein
MALASKILFTTTSFSHASAGLPGVPPTRSLGHDDRVARVRDTRITLAIDVLIALPSSIGSVVGVVNSAT